MNYSVDSSSLIHLARLHPADLFVSLWAKLDESFASGMFRVSEEVYKELCKGTDDLAGWLKARPQCMVATDTNIESHVQAIMKSHPTLVQIDLQKSGADPYVIAVAIQNTFRVLTQERPKKPTSTRPKIPDVCESYSVDCFDFVDMARTEGWRL